MKRITIVLIIGIFAMMMSATAQITVHDSVLAVPKLATPPVIDGVEDSAGAWLLVPRTLMMNIVSGEENVYDWYDWAAFFKAAYDENNFYLYLWCADEELLDDTAGEDGSGNAWEDDSYEVYFDADYSHGASYDAMDDMQLRFPWNGWNERISGNHPSGLADVKETWLYEQAEHDIGWSFELAMPHEDTFLDGVPGQIFGFEVDGNDDDSDVDARDSKLKWWALNDNAWASPYEFGTAETVDRLVGDELDVVKATQDIVIDGIMEDTWKAAAWIPGNYFGSVFEGNWNNFEDWYDLKVDSKVMWDSKGIVYFLSAWDESLVFGETNDWQDDSFELYFDSDNSKGATYDGVDDAQIRINWDETADELAVITVGGGIAPEGWDPADYEVMATETDYGWDVEVRFPFDAVMLDAKEGIDFGWEIDYNDDDEADGSSRTSKLKTWGPNDNTWQYPYLMGTAVLAGTGVGVASTTPATVSEYALAQNYPNPFNPTTTISYSVAKTGMVELKVYDVLGKEVAHLVNGVKPAGQYTVAFDGTDVSSGIYFYTMTTGNQHFTQKMMLVK
jgi:hypothetical protein